jgi:hypothetical protein
VRDWKGKLSSNLWRIRITVSSTAPDTFPWESCVKRRHCTHRKVATDCDEDGEDCSTIGYVLFAMCEMVRVLPSLSL